MLLPGQEPVEEGWARAEAWGLAGGVAGRLSLTSSFQPLQPDFC